MNIALILSGGTGTRLGGDIPKQYIEVSNRPMIGYVLDTFLNHNDIDGVQIVADAQWHGLIKECIDEIKEDNEKISGKCVGFSKPGANRQLSILNGLRDIKNAGWITDDDNVIIQDAARPLTSMKLIDSIIDRLKEHEAVTPTLPIKDTVYYVDAGGKFTGTADRSSLAAGQAPEGFRFGRFLEATESLLPDKIYEVTGSLQTALLYGMNAKSVPGDENNFKVTTQADLTKFIDIIRFKNN